MADAKHGATGADAATAAAESSETGKSKAAARKGRGTGRAKAATAKGKVPAKAKKGKTAAAKRKAPARKPAARKTKAAPDATPGTARLDEVLGQVTRLMAGSPRHRHLFLADLEWLVLPPMLLDQSIVLRGADGEPAAFACWAKVDDAVEKRLETGNPRLKPAEWRCGEKLWLIDVVCAEAILPDVLATLSQKVFKGETVRTLFRAPKPAKAATELKG